MKANFINESEFIAIIANLKGCQFATIAYSSDAVSNNKKLQGGKKNPYYNRVVTITEIASAQIGKNYENAVNNRTAERDFEAEALPWGEWIRPNYLIGHKGATYLRAYKCKTTKTSKKFYLDGKAVTDGKVEKEIQANFREHSESKRQSDAGIAVEDQVKPFNVNVTNIVFATINGTTYQVTH